MKNFALSLLGGVSLLALAMAPASAWDSHHGGNQQQAAPSSIDVLIAYNKNSSVTSNVSLTAAPGGLNNNGDGSNIGGSALGAGAVKANTANAAPTSFSPCSCTTSGLTLAAAINSGSPVSSTLNATGVGNNNGTGTNISGSATGAMAAIQTTTNFASAAPSAPPSGGGHGH
jgi:hypothetical protein